MLSATSIYVSLNSHKGDIMLRAAIAFLVIGIIAFAVGAGNIGGLSMDVGRTLLFVFVGLAVLSFLGTLITGSGNPKLK